MPTLRARAFDYALSANLYRTPLQGELYECAVSTDEYRSAVAIPMHSANASVPGLLARLLKYPSEELDVLDCGPADARAAVGLLRALQAVVTVRKYSVVDINPRLLKQVVERVRAEAGVAVRACRSAFEDINRRLVGHDEKVRSLVLFGNTALNYPPEELRRLMRGLAQRGDLVMLQILLRSRSAQKLPYETSQVVDFVFEPLRDIGFRRDDMQFVSRQGAQEILVGFKIIKAPIAKMDGRSWRKGDVLWTARTMRYSESGYERVCKKMFARHVTSISHGSVATTLGEIR